MRQQGVFSVNSSIFIVFLSRHEFFCGIPDVFFKDGGIIGNVRAENEFSAGSVLMSAPIEVCRGKAVCGNSRFRPYGNPEPVFVLLCEYAHPDPVNSEGNVDETFRFSFPYAELFCRALVYDHVCHAVSGYFQVAVEKVAEKPYPVFPVPAVQVGYYSVPVHSCGKQFRGHRECGWEGGVGEIVCVAGLENVTYFEKVTIWEKGMGYVNQINENSVTVAIVKENAPIKIGDIVKTTGEQFKAVFAKEAIGRIVDIFGTDLLSGKAFEKIKYINIENETIPIMDRREVKRPMLTGIAGIDLIYPIGKGQRQLIIGDKKTGKTQIALDTIVNQGSERAESENDVVCIYIAVGKTKKEIKTIYNELLKRGALSYTTMVVATNDDKQPVVSLIPFVGLSIAEEYMKMKKDVIVVIDDLKKHADTYREISLISGKTPGREAYPADIFYLHARLLEKGCQYKNGGSITILPIVETKGGDITDYISTNIISITDGQIVMSEKEFAKGNKPAINYKNSVSRLGGAVQKPEIKSLGAQIRRTFLSYLETKEVYELANMDEMTEELRNKMKIGAQIQEALNQPKFMPLSNEEIIDKFEAIVKQEGYTNEN